MQPENFNEYIAYLLNLLEKQMATGEWWQYVFAFVGVLLVAALVTYINLYLTQLVNGLIIFIILAIAAWCAVELIYIGVRWYNALIVCGLIAAFVGIPFLYISKLAELVRKSLNE